MTTRTIRTCAGVLALVCPVLSWIVGRYVAPNAGLVFLYAGAGSYVLYLAMSEKEKHEVAKSTLKIEVPPIKLPPTFSWNLPDTIYAHNGTVVKDGKVVGCWKPCTIFSCKLCGAKYPALPPEPPVSEDPKYPHHMLRAVFYREVDKMMRATPDVLDKHVKQVERASMDYFSAIRYTGVERVPDELDFKKGIFRCVGGCKEGRR